ncbi:MAG: hypothetical protein ACSI46_06340 [Gloeotrichia echinulata DVL01]
MLVLVVYDIPDDKRRTKLSNFLVVCQFCFEGFLVV